MNKLVHLEKDDGIAIITIDNPPMNVLNGQVSNELEKVFLQIAKDPEVISVILTGAGNRAFMAGADIKEFPQILEMGKEEFKKVNLNTHQVFNLIQNFPKPTIALLNGITFGGGCELALTCDIRIAEEHVQIGLPEVKLGLFPGGGGTQRLPRLVGESKAKEMMFIGDPISAEDALKIGLVNRVVPSGEGMNEVLTMAKKISGYSLLSLNAIKQAINEGMNTSFELGLDLEGDLFADVCKGEDVKEGVNAFLEKRTPKFIHR